MASSEIYRAPIGTKDVIGEESRQWQEIIRKFAVRAHLYNYDLAITPTFENYEVFSRVGEDTDIVTKEMYDFVDKGDRHVALKPEGTAGVVRAIAQHRPVMPCKLWYFTSVFRYERPQKGRLREHHQLGIEVFGIHDPEIDVEVIQFAYEFLIDCGVKDFTLCINSLGDSKARSHHMKELQKYFSKYEDEYGEDFMMRVRRNPLRLLDTKVEEWKEIMKDAPQILDYVSDESKQDFDFVCDGLKSRGIEYKIVPQLVRGLDYYTNTTFEFISHSLDAAQSTICAGGRYNKLVTEMGGPEIPGIGFGVGVERLLLACGADRSNFFVRGLDVMVIDLVNNDDSALMVRSVKDILRNSGYSVDSVFDGKSMKAAMKQSDRVNAKNTIIIGDEELASNVVSLKNMSSGEQYECGVDEIVSSLQ